MTRKLVINIVRETVRVFFLKFQELQKTKQIPIGSAHEKSLVPKSGPAYLINLTSHIVHVEPDA
jgi:hypothetical protein